MRTENTTEKKGNCKECLCRTCANLKKASVRCGNTEYYCKHLCGGEFQTMTQCTSYHPKNQIKSA